MMRFVRFVAVLLLLPVGAAVAQATASHPNVVLIITDDMGYADLAAYGAKDVRTPNIDALAKAGVRLTDFYSNGVLCSPTRAGLMSGRYQQRYGVETALPSAAPAGEMGLRANGRTLPQLMRNAGYATALIGKWHLGYKPEMSPNAHGFDFFFGLKSGYHDYYTHKSNDGNPDLWQNDSLVNVTGYMTDLITERAVQFIRRNAQKPFFVDIAYNAPHWPFQVPDSPSVARNNGAFLFPGDSATSTRNEYVRMVERVDRGVGEILRTLERAGLANNTIVIFTNDNGGEWLSNNGPLFNRKWTVWEGGIRVPAIVRWPGKIRAGSVSSQVGITMDLTASIVAVAGAKLPDDTHLEGVDLFSILQGKSPVVERTLFWRTSSDGRVQKAVRSGDWKIVLDGHHTFVYNIRADIGERHDLANQRQDVARRLRGLLTAWERDVDAEAKPKP
jgi:arylsulfatase A-like enzyme